MREKPLMRALEPRVLLDAAMVETALDAARDNVHQGMADDWMAKQATPTATFSESSFGGAFDDVLLANDDESSIAFSYLDDEQRLVQSFVVPAGATDFRVTDIELFLHSRANNGTFETVNIAILRPNANGNGIFNSLGNAGTVVATGNLQVEGTNPKIDRWIRGTLDAPVDLTPGDMYFIRVENPENNDEIGLGYSNDIDYADGELAAPDVARNAGDDLLFRLIDAADPNVAPEFIDPVGPVRFLSQLEDERDVMILEAYDPDGPDGALTYTISGGADAALFELAGTTLRFIDEPDHENPLGSAFGVPNSDVYEVEVTVADPDGGADMATIYVSIDDANEAPLTSDYTLERFDDGLVSLNFGIWDNIVFDPDDGDVLDSVTLTNVALLGGRLVHSGNVDVVPGVPINRSQIDSLQFVPVPGTRGSVTFDYSAATVNGVGTSTSSAGSSIFTITFSDPVNTVPEAGLTTATAFEDTTYFFGVNDFDLGDRDGDATQIVITGLNLSGGTLLGGDGTPVTLDDAIAVADLEDLTFRAAPDSTATAWVEFRADDAIATGTDTGRVTITVDPIDDAPEATGFAVSIDEDTDLPLPLTAFPATDIDGGPRLSVSFDNLDLRFGALIYDDAGTARSVTDGDTLTAAQLNTLVFRPFANVSGTVRFDYAVNATAMGPTADATWARGEITVAPVNDAPRGSPVADRTSDDRETVAISITGAFQDLDDTTLGYSASGLPDGLSIDPTSGLISGTIDQAASNASPYSVAIEARDDDGATATVSFIWTILNPAPVAVADDLTIRADSILSGSLATNDFDPDGGALTYVLSSGPVSGSLLLDPDGSFVFMPDVTSSGTVSFEYSVTDGQGAQVQAVGVVTVTAAPVVEPPPPPPAPPPAAPPVAPEPEPESEEEDEEEEEEEDGGGTDAGPTGPPDLPGSSDGPTKAPARAAPAAAEASPLAPVDDEPQQAVAVAPVFQDGPAIARSLGGADGIGGYTFTPMDEGAVAKDIERAGDEMRRFDTTIGATVAKVTFTFGSVLAVGSVSWLLQGGALAAALLSAMPAWRRFDPIEIVGERNSGEEDEPSNAARMMAAVQDAGARVKAGVKT